MRQREVQTRPLPIQGPQAMMRPTKGVRYRQFTLRYAWSFKLGRNLAGVRANVVSRHADTNPCLKQGRSVKPLAAYGKCLNWPRLQKSLFAPNKDFQVLGLIEGLRSWGRSRYLTIILLHLRHPHKLHLELHVYNIPSRATYRQSESRFNIHALLEVATWLLSFN